MTQYATRTEALVLAALAIAAAMPAFGQTASTGSGQGYPARPIRFVLGFAPGGASDTMARTIGTRLSEGLGQPVVIDNRAGAGGNIAAEIVARSFPTVHRRSQHGILAVNVRLTRTRLRPVRDFAPGVMIVHIQRMGAILVAAR